MIVAFSLRRSSFYVFITEEVKLVTQEAGTFQEAYLLFVFFETTVKDYLCGELLRLI